MSTQDNLSTATYRYSNGSALKAQVAPLWAVATAVVLLRCAIRLRCRTLGQDDYCMALAAISASACFICYMVEISLGLGRHPEVLEAKKDRYSQLLKARLLHQIFVVLGLCLVKMSICLLLLRLVRKTWQIRGLWGIFVFQGIFTIVCELTLIFQCFPVAAAWNYELRLPPLGSGTAQCYSDEVFGALGLVNGVIHILTDFLLAILPIPLVWHLQRDTATRISIILVLSLGIFAATAGIIRQLNIGPLDEHDAYSIWNFNELHIGIIAASLPTLRPLIERSMRKIHTTITHAATNNESFAVHQMVFHTPKSGRMNGGHSNEFAILRTVCVTSHSQNDPGGSHPYNYTGTISADKELRW